jgi:hypothetical protein
MNLMCTSKVKEITVIQQRELSVTQVFKFVERVENRVRLLFDRTPSFLDGENDFDRN